MNGQDHGLNIWVWRRVKPEQPNFKLEVWRHQNLVLWLVFNLEGEELERKNDDEGLFDDIKAVDLIKHE